MQPEVNKKNEWAELSNADKSDPAFATALEVVDDQSDTARWLRMQQGALTRVRP